jgi:hypothetical protein
MTALEIIDAANQIADPDERETFVEKQLEKYDGGDKELVEAWIWEATAALGGELDNLEL